MDKQNEAAPAAAGREKLGEQARDILMAEALGDLQRIREQLQGFDAQVRALVENQDAGAKREWLAILDSKMREFQNFQIPEIAAARLQVHAETFFRGVMGEVKHLVSIEVKRQSNRQNIIWMAVMFAAGFAFASILYIAFK